MYDWEGRRSRRAQIIKFAAASLITATIIAAPMVVAGFRIGL
jgi:hypothetical protein